MRYSRGVHLTHWLVIVLGSASVLAALIGLIQLVSVWVGIKADADLGWFFLGLALAILTVCGHSSSWLKRLLSDADSSAHRARRSVVWVLVSAVILLITGLKIGSIDTDAYKSLVFGEGGLVEWGQVIILSLACRVAWLIGADLRAQFQNPFPQLLARGFAVTLGILVMEELAWGQVIFGWETPESIRSINAQQETTLHNIGWFQDRLDFFAFLATLTLLLIVVLVPWISKRALHRLSSQRQSLIEALLPASYTWPLFLSVVGLAYCVATRSFSEVIVNRSNWMLLDRPQMARSQPMSASIPTTIPA